jgi:hypothetical protein
MRLPFHGLRRGHWCFIVAFHSGPDSHRRMAMKPERATSAKVAEPSGGMCGFLAAKLPVRSLSEKRQNRQNLKKVRRIGSRNSRRAKARQARSRFQPSSSSMKVELGSGL